MSPLCSKESSQEEEAGILSKVINPLLAIFLPVNRTFPQSFFIPHPASPVGYEGSESPVRGSQANGRSESGQGALEEQRDTEGP